MTYVWRMTDPKLSANLHRNLLNDLARDVDDLFNNLLHWNWHLTIEIKEVNKTKWPTNRNQKILHTCLWTMRSTGYGTWIKRETRFDRPNYKKNFQCVFFCCPSHTGLSTMCSTGTGIWIISGTALGKKHARPIYKITGTCDSEVFQQINESGPPAACQLAWFRDGMGRRDLLLFAFDSAHTFSTICSTGTGWLICFMTS